SLCDLGDALFVFGFRPRPRATLFPYTTLFRSFSRLGSVDQGGGVWPRNWDHMVMLVICMGWASSLPSGPRGPSRIALMLVISGWVRQSVPSPAGHLRLATSKSQRR